MTDTVVEEVEDQPVGAADLDTEEELSFEEVLLAFEEVLLTFEEILSAFKEVLLAV